MAKRWGQETEAEKKLREKLKAMSFTEYLAWANVLREKANDLRKRWNDTLKVSDTMCENREDGWYAKKKEAKALEYRYNQAKDKAYFSVDVEARAGREMKKGDVVAKAWLIDYLTKKAKEELAEAEERLKEVQAEVYAQREIIYSLGKGIIPKQKEDEE